MIWESFGLAMEWMGRGLAVEGARKGRAARRKGRVKSILWMLAAMSSI